MQPIHHQYWKVFLYKKNVETELQPLLCEESPLYYDNPNMVSKEFTGCQDIRPLLREEKLKHDRMAISQYSSLTNKSYRLHICSK